MPPKVPKATAHDDHKSDTPHKDKGGHGSSTHYHNNLPHHHHYQPNGKMKRVASAAGSNLREVTNASATSPGNGLSAAGTSQEHTMQGVRWSSFERSILHAYRREYRLATPTSFAEPYHQLVLSQAGSIGLFSPTMARRKEVRRQSKEELAIMSRKHFNSLGIQETEVIAAVLHKVKNEGITKKRKRPEQMPLLEPDRPYPK